MVNDLSMPKTPRADAGRELREALDAARDADTRLHSIVDSAMDAIISVDSKQRITLFNRAAERIFGYESREVLGQPLEMLMPDRFRKSHHGFIGQFGRTGVGSRPMGHQRIVAAQRRSGEEFPIDASISHVRVGTERYYTVILRDVSRRVATERDLARVREDLRELAVASRTAREQENARISRELHDELGQNLTSLKMDVAYLQQKLGSAEPEVKKTIDEMRGLLDITMAATRRISSDLRPLLLDDLGLAAALEWLGKETSRRHGFVVELSVSDECQQLPEPLASQVFRIIQESLTNVSRHAQAKNVRISIARKGSQIELCVEDDGRGLTSSDLEKKGSFGLVGIRERVYMLQGRVDFQGEPGRGTRILANLPATETNTVSP
jgi:PAS domain S-box-containing protein